MASTLRLITGPAACWRVPFATRCMSSADSQLPSWGSGVGKGGGAGGTVSAIRCMSSADSQLPSWGSGVGKGGGAGGTVRESGGAFGVREAAMEEQYFRRLTEEQLKQLHDHYVEEINYLKQQLKEQQEIIVQKKQRLKQLMELTTSDHP